MLSSKKLQRINELAHKSKSEGLNPEERIEQQKLREEYLQTFRKGFKKHLHGIKVVDPEGNDVTPKKLKVSKRNQNNLH
ncbi:DUF896 domain-containing protein [Bacillus taeanensis]|uniref:UPF0291 protein DS031_08755 n=1 Tax=Bacillus taeanensis TaxID=273032 RepID=A0A366XVK9_9BACI|nr:DUF896 domain-containing protein [Bacillus taeanensis]RBW69937.1 hypothetical protein DS031_08755 [Bacillus taeanensis]